MNQILLYGGFCLSGIMFLFCLIIWFRFHIWKSWCDIASYRSKKLSVNRNIKNGYDRTKLLSEQKTNDTILLESDSAGWSMIDEILFIHTNEV